MQIRSTAWWCGVASMALAMCAGGLTQALANDAAAPTEKHIRFVPGGWDAEEWTPLRMINQTAPFELAQLADGIGTTTNTFVREDYSKERDNALLVYDTGMDEFQVDVTFSLGKGFSHYSSPGICISPVISNGVFQTGIGVFVANYAMVAWYEYNAEDGKRVRYAHMGQIARYTDPDKRHVLRYRVNVKQRNLALQLDDSDVMVFSFVGHPKLSFVPHTLNSKLALWGCHGASTFHEMRVAPGGSLPFLVREPPE